MTKIQNLRILIVDDEKAIRRFLNASLTSSGHLVFEAETGTEALEKSVSCHPDVIILDLGLPDIDGISIIQKIRKRSKIPIIVLSVREDVSIKVNALLLGADDYLIKPFNITELSARLWAVMRRLLPSDQEEVFHAGKLTMDIAKHKVISNGSEVDLTPTEYNVLKLLIINIGKVLTHRQILQEIWDKSEKLEGVLHLLRVTISNLRGKIEPNPDSPTYILTEPGIGYRFHSDS